MSDSPIGRMNARATDEGTANASWRQAAGYEQTAQPAMSLSFLRGRTFTAVDAGLDLMDTCLVANANPL